MKGIRKSSRAHPVLRAPNESNIGNDFFNKTWSPGGLWFQVSNEAFFTTDNDFHNQC